MGELTNLRDNFMLAGWTDCDYFDSSNFEHLLFYL